MSFQGSFHKAILGPVQAIALLATLCIPVLTGTQASAQAVGRGITNLELPRFVSLKARKANVRVGPGKNYAIAYRYLRRDMPLEVLQEFDTWRKVRDAEGSEGWIHGSLLQGKRTIITAPWNSPVEMMGKDPSLRTSQPAPEPKPVSPEKVIVARTHPSQSAAATIRFEPGVIAFVDRCDGKWCRISHKQGAGWVTQASLWGVYPDEKLED